MHFTGILVENTEGDVAAPKDVTALLTPPLEENTTHPSNGRLAPQSPSQIPPSSPPSSPPSEPAPSDRHGYRFRCSRCSLAFPTQEKLKLHWQYHAMRAATECPLCSRQCRSQEALQRHMQNTHSQLDNTQVQNTLLQSQTAQCMENNKTSVQQEFSLSPQVGQEAGGEGEGEEDEEMDKEALCLEENEEQKEDRIKEKDMASEVKGSEEDLRTETEMGSFEVNISETSSSSLVKKSSNPTMDRYLDPSRPYKCTICSESFTQKTILLVHYNSVSHLHRARRALQDSGTGVVTPEAPRGPDSRPYRCRLCGVAYSQSSTLDIHLRSVLHQTRARAAQNPAPSNPASGVPVPLSVPTTTTQVPTREETSKSLLFTKRSDVVNSSTSSLLCSGLPAEAQTTHSDSTNSKQAKKRVAELLASRNQLMLMQQQQLVQAQAQAQAQLQQHTALLQSQVIQHIPLGQENLLKQHFSLTPDNLLSLQQQLLLPFYLSGDMNLNQEFGLKIQELSPMATTNTIPREKPKAKSEFATLTDEKQNQRRSSTSTNNKIKDHMDCDATADASCIRPSLSQTERDQSRSSTDDEKEEMPVAVVTISPKEETESPPVDLLGLQYPPPRVPYAAANGEPLKALLQSYGYELALQYIQNRHRHQQQVATQMIQDKQECSYMNKITEKQPMERDEFSDLCDGKIEGCNKNNKTGQSNRETESFPQEKSDNKYEESANKKKRCCGETEKCGDCGKFFSDALILKSHQEYIHRSVFPTAALERFSRKYRLQYDQMYPLKKNKCGESLSASPETTASVPTSSSPSEPEPVKPQAKTLAPSPLLSVSDPETTTDTTPPAPAPSSPSSPLQNLFPQQDTPIPSTSVTATSQTPSSAMTISLPLPKIPMLPLPLPQLPIPSMPITKLPLPPIPFPIELPLLSPVVMQSVSLQPQPWLDSSVNPELAKLYHSQLNSALLGQQPPLSPALLNQPSQLNPSLLSQPCQPSPVQTGHQSQVSPTILEHQGKRTRTRISEDQLTVLREHFDINSLPSDEEINNISAMSGLPHKVIKHWFRNTLFKERQRDKDSPYNFNNPPTIALEESREEVEQNQSLTLSPCSLSPSLPATSSSQPQTTELQRVDIHRGRRSSRTRFTEQQLETLQGVFEATPYPREEEYDRLSALLSLPNRVIVVWFQNARQRARKNQDRGTDDGFEGKNPLDNIQRQTNGYSKNNNDDNEDKTCGDERQGDSQNENSMDLTYEYYTHPDSPLPDSSTKCTEGELLTPVTKKYEDVTVSPQAKKSITLVQSHNGISVGDNQCKEIVQATKIGSSPQPETEQQPEIAPERSDPCSSSSSLVPTTTSVSHSSPEHTHSSPSDQDLKILADASPSLASAQQSENSYTRLPNANSSLSTESQQHNHLQSQAQFHCSLCSMSLPSFHLWQEHQTRHLLAAQSQVQLLHSGFTDRTMPYMMLHPNHSLMASQMLSGAISQMHPNPTHPIISHLNSMQIKNTLSDHTSNLNSLSQSSLTPMKQNTKLIPDANIEVQRGGREIEEEQRRDKRQRTTITPEQLEVLYQRYSLDSNPTRGVLESIARDVGLTRRVVQVL